MTHPSTTAGHFFGPARPPKPSCLTNEVSDPLYETTLPKQSLHSSPKLKGILKNGTGSTPPIHTNRRMSAPSPRSSNTEHPPPQRTHKDNQRLPLQNHTLPSKGIGNAKNNSIVEDQQPLKRTKKVNRGFSRTNNSSLNRNGNVKHFDLKIKQPGNLPTEEANELSLLNGRLGTQNVSNAKVSNCRNVSSIEETANSYASKSRRNLDFHMSDEKLKRARFAARIESMAGIAHLFVIVMSIITLSVLAKVTSTWELQIRRCPMYVKTIQDTGVHWGNEKLAACHYSAYMPALIIVMSLSLILLHGGILYSWRNGTQTSILLLSTTYAKIIFWIEFLELVIAISVAGVILDGVRQTCLSFQLNPWPEQRPENCKAGYKERDDIYGISKTYSRLITGMATSIISVCLLILTSIFYLIRMNPKCCGRPA